MYDRESFPQRPGDFSPVKTMERPQPSIPDDPNRPASGAGGLPKSPEFDTSNHPTLADVTLAADASLTSSSLSALSARYEILGEAGRGAMGRVYKVRDRETNEIVALKLLKPEIAGDHAMLERFKSELMFARRITHKNVCRVYEFNRAGDIAYISMEFVEGESLRSVLQRFGSLTVRKGSALALQMCSGLQEAHANGIVHRDLKPENVMIDVRGDVKIMDFGIAHSMEALSRLTGAMTGTPAYMAPEQVSGKTVDYRTDIYALGLMLYEMFTGRQPFQAENGIAVALKQLNEAPPPPRDLEPGIPPALEQTILKCLEKEPARRFQSIAELNATLRSERFPTTLPPAPAHGLAETGSEAAVAAVNTRPRRHTVLWVALLLVALAGAAMLVAWRSLQVGSPVEKIASPPAPAPAPAVSAQQTPTSSKGENPKVEAAHVAKPSKSGPSQSSAAPVTQAATPGPFPGIGTPSIPAVGPNLGNFLGGLTPITGQPAMVLIWVGRYPRESGAQKAVQEIEDLGLPVSVRPRHNAATNSDFFVVTSGPFPAAQADSVLQQLHSKGFRGAQLLKGSRAKSAAEAPLSPPQE